MATPGGSMRRVEAPRDDYTGIGRQKGLDNQYTDRYNGRMDNRSTILQRALELFTAFGYDASGVQEICESAGITKPTLYHYFGSKRGLFEALLSERHSILDRAVGDAGYYRGDLAVSLERVARALFDFARAEPLYYRLLLAMYFASPHSEAHQLMAGRLLSQHLVLEALFRAAAADAPALSGRERLLAASYLGLLNTCVGLWLNGHAELDETLLRAAVHQFQFGIYA